MKKFIISVVCLGSLLSANTFDSHKEKILSFQQAKIDIIKQSMSCIKSSTSKEDLKSCRSVAKESRSKLKSKRKQFKQDRKNKK